jgi:hypothetical protein
MKKDKNIISFYVLLLGIGSSLAYLSYTKFNTFFNSNFFLAIVTLLVGGTAIALYLKQKSDHKRDSAQLIIQEIRYAEHQIKDARVNEYNYQLADKLLPTNSWHKNIHLFVNDLKESEIDIISRFYTNAAYLDVVIEKISDHQNSNFINVVNVNQATIPTSPTPNQNFSIILPLPSQQILKIVSEKIDFIYNTPAIDKLRFISER